MHITHLDQLKSGNEFSFINEDNLCTVLFTEEGTNNNILFYQEGEAIKTLTFPFYVDTDRNDYVMCEQEVKAQELIINYVLNEQSGITHLGINGRPVCGNRFNVGNAILSDGGIVTCGKCLGL